MNLPDDTSWITNYLCAEANGSVGGVCVYQGSSLEAIREQAQRADLPADEIVEVASTVTAAA
jgi:Protein of unknown function (DUF4242)